MEKSRSWPSAHDWKSCIPQKGIEGSNPSFSAIIKSTQSGGLYFFVDYWIIASTDVEAIIYESLFIL